jgi:large subunit ribosomal protein L21
MAYAVIKTGGKQYRVQQGDTLDVFRDVKGIAFKFKRRKGFHKTKGFRRHLTKLEIISIA